MFRPVRTTFGGATTSIPSAAVTAQAIRGHRRTAVLTSSSTGGDRGREESLRDTAIPGAGVLTAQCRDELATDRVLLVGGQRRGKAEQEVVDAVIGERGDPVGALRDRAGDDELIDPPVG